MNGTARASRSLRSTTRRQLVEIIAPRRVAVLCIAASILAGAGLELVPPLVMRQIVDTHLVPGIASGLWALAAFYLASVAGVQGLGFLSNYLTAWTAQGALKELRVRLYRHLQGLPLSYYDQNPLGDTISRCTADVDTVDTLFSSGVAGLVGDLVRLATVAAAMIALSPVLSLVSALVVPPLLWVTNAFRKRIRKAEGNNRVAVGMMNTHLQETLGGVEVIRAFGREPGFVERFRRVLMKTVEASNRAAKFSSIYTPIMQMLMAVVVTLLLWSGARATIASVEVSLGTLTAFVLLFKRFFDPITALGEEWQTVQGALSAAERIFQLLDLPLEGVAPDAVGAAAMRPRQEATHAAVPGRNAGHPGGAAQRGLETHGPAGIEVSQVVFGYLPGVPVLHGVSFAMRHGEHVALVGRTGSGKSSLVNLLGGLYAPWAGQLSVAGLDPRGIDEHERRRVIGVVPQTVQLFTGTILENLTLGDSTVAFDAVTSAAIVAGADGFIRALPRGYHTPVSSGSGAGAQLSSGQRQLLSLVRALVWNPVVLLLDEATSAIDSASEAAFRQALAREPGNGSRTILTVAHRLSTARAADRVIVLEHGRILESGSPEELIRAEGRFAALLELESAGWDWRSDDPDSV